MPAPSRDAPSRDAHGLTARGQPPSLRLRRLAAELRALRAAAKLTRDHAAQRTRLNNATLWRIETARTRPQRRTLLALLDLYGVAEESRRAELLDLTQPGAPVADLSPPTDGRPLGGYATRIGFEAEACQVSLFEARFVPDLLQTPEYARAALTGLAPEADATEVERQVALRLRRRARLDTDPPLRVHAVVDESALHRRIGTDRVHHNQLRWLADLARQPQVTFRVLPYRAGAHPGLHGDFTLLDFPDPADASLVCVETATGVSLVEDEASLARYRSRFARLCDLALDPAGSRRLLTALDGR